MATGTTDLSVVLTELGVELKRVGDKEISGCCPVHLKRTGRHDRSPSWSMNAQTGLWLCYSCGARGTLSSLVSEITGREQSVLEVHRFLIETGLRRLTEPSPQEEPQPEVDWVTYSRFGDVPERLLFTKDLDAHIARSYGIRWDSSNKCWVIPIVAPTGELLGWQSKKKGWVRNYPVGVKKSHTLFGIERFTGTTAVLVESPLDVVRLASMSDIKGLATFGAYVSAEQIKLLSSVAHKVIVAMDNDEAGIEANKRLFKTLPRFNGGTHWLDYSHTNAKDIGDMTDDEIHQAINNSSAVPWWCM